MKRTPHILVIEDDLSWRRLLRRLLEKNSYRCTAVETGRTGVLRAKGLLPDLVVLDLHLEDMNGFEVMQLLRGDSQTKGIPILAITGLKDPADLLKVASLDLHSKDFLSKSLPPNEILRHIESALIEPRTRPTARASSGHGKMNPREIERGRIKIDLELRRVRLSGKPVRQLGPKRFELLCALTRRAKGLSLGALRKAVWGDEGDTNTVVKTIQRLRADLRRAGKDPIVSIPGGYRLRA